MTVVFRDDNHIPEMIVAVEKAIDTGLENLEDKTLDQIDRNMANDRDAMGHPWIPLADQTVELKGHDSILEDTGDLRDAFDGDLDTDEDILEIYNDDWKAPIHEFGSHERNIPRRAFMRPAATWVKVHGYKGTLLPPLRAAPTVAKL